METAAAAAGEDSQLQMQDRIDQLTAQVAELANMFRSSTQGQQQEQRPSGVPSASQDGGADWSATGTWTDRGWQSGWWSESQSWQRPYLSHITFPSFDGNAQDFAKYKYEARGLRNQCSPNDYRYLVPQLVAQLKDPLKTSLVNATLIQLLI